MQAKRVRLNIDKGDFSCPPDAHFSNAVGASADEGKQSKKLAARPNLFYQKKARLLWRKLKKMLNKKELVDLTTVSTTLSDEEISDGCTHVYVVDCSMAAGLSSSAEVYTKKLYEKYLMRRVIDETNKIQTSAQLLMEI